MDFAIVYFGLTRSIQKVFESHQTHIYNVLQQNKLSYQIFMHTWKTTNNKQLVWGEYSSKEINYDEHKLLHPNFYEIENQDDYINTINRDDYFYTDVWNTYGCCPNGEWLPCLVRNHVCALASMKKGIEMVEKQPIQFKYIMFIRPDIKIKKDIPVHKLMFTSINIPDFDHYDGFNDRFAVMNYEHAMIYGKRIDELVHFRKTQGRIVSEHYLKFIIQKYKIPVNLIPFKFELVRP
jgi:hypothetical protein